MAHTKAGGSTKNWGDAIAKRLGVKLFGGEKVDVGQIIIRQRGTKYFPGRNVATGGDDTLYALKAGLIAFSQKTKTRFDGDKKTITIVSVQ